MFEGLQGVATFSNACLMIAIIIGVIWLSRWLEGRENERIYHKLSSEMEKHKGKPKPEYQMVTQDMVEEWQKSPTWRKLAGNAFEVYGITYRLISYNADSMSYYVKKINSHPNPPRTIELESPYLSRDEIRRNLELLIPERKPVMQYTDEGKVIELFPDEQGVITDVEGKGGAITWEVESRLIDFTEGENLQHYSKRYDSPPHNFDIFDEVD